MRNLYISAIIFLILALGGVPRPGAGNDLISEPIKWDKTEPEFQNSSKHSKMHQLIKKTPLDLQDYLSRL